ncbi:hypothetical protein [Cupriavidus sp. YR651]|uniref:hypothetical protein n=1 Tax=Cupriavidus sp. YR651 TaxID=1855315 RepID=UPI00159FE9D9|nr:hypothetical protein [Cupriavidus sp. YR651]
MDRELLRFDLGDLLCEFRDPRYADMPMHLRLTRIELRKVVAELGGLMGEW